MRQFLSMAAIAAVIASTGAAPASASGYVFGPNTSRPTGSAHSTISLNGTVIKTCDGMTEYQVNGAGAGSLLKLGFGNTACPSVTLTTMPRSMTATGPQAFTVAGPVTLTYASGTCTFSKLTGTLVGTSYSLTGKDGAGCVLTTTGTMDAAFYIDVAPKRPPPTM